MTAQELFMWAVVGCGGLMSRRNLTAFALAASWLVGQIYYLATGDGLALSEYFMADVAVVAMIYAKTIRRVGAKTYPKAWLHAKCFFLDLTVWDRFVVAIFLLGSWPAYVLELGEYAKFWLLYWLTVAQFMFAGAEALIAWHRTRKVPKLSDTPNADIIPFIPHLNRRFVGAGPVATSGGGGGARC